ncbi:MAG TPA: hypothetical protein V6D13_14515 [Halomicronema sp.]
MKSKLPKDSLPESTNSQIEWYQPIIPGLEEFMAQLNQQPKTTDQPQSK